MAMKTLILIPVLILSLAQAVSAEFDPPAPPAIEVRVLFTGYTSIEDMDDGLDGETEIKIDFTVVPIPGLSRQSGASNTFYFTFDYDDLSGGEGLFYDSDGNQIGYILYKTTECWPVSEFNLYFNVEEVDTPGINENDPVGANSIRINSSGNYTLRIPDKMEFNIRVEANPLRDESEECMYFYDQPETMSSSIVTKNGTYIYDFELANMLKMWIGDNHSNMMFIFQQCFAGGMADDIVEMLNGSISVLSASRHDGFSWGYPDRVSPFTKEVIERLRNNSSAVDAFLGAERYDEFGPYGRPLYNPDENVLEHPQFVSEGDGGNATVGRATDGSEVKSRHAIIFGGDNDAEEYWANIEAFYDLLKSKGFTDEDIVVLADSGRSVGRDYVDGPGTKQALWNAIRDLSSKMNESEQLVFYVTDHGNLEQKSRALNRVINDPVRQPVVPEEDEIRFGDEWVLDDNFLDALNLTDENEPYIGIVISFSPEYDVFNKSTGKPVNDRFIDEITLYFNGEPLFPEHYQEMYALDTDPDLDGYEVIFPLKEDLIMKRNKMEISHRSLEYFIPFNIELVLISTGAVPDLTSDRKPETMTLMPSVENPEEMRIILNSSGKHYVFTDSLNLSENEMHSLLSQGRLFELILKKKEWYNSNTDQIPSFLKFLAGNERINVEIIMKGNQTMKISIVTENSRIVELKRESLDNPSARAKLSEETAKQILNSDSPVSDFERAYRNGEIDYQGVGFINALKVQLVKIFSGIYYFISNMLG